MFCSSDLRSWSAGTSPWRTSAGRSSPNAYSTPGTPAALAARTEGWAAGLQRALGAQPLVPDAGPGRVTAVPGLVDPLTSRELEVLEMLAASRSNQAIASQLVVTLDTVKKHISHILGKLGAANRTEAVTRARELSLIP